jgi:WD40 repeat protein
MPYTVWIWDISTLTPISLISCSNQIRSIKWTKKENYLSIITGTERILFWKENGTIA